MTKVRESKTRSLAKTLTWRLTGSSATALVAFVLTKDFSLAGTLGLSQAVLNSILYWFHERVWAKVVWGINKGANYE